MLTREQGQLVREGVPAGSVAGVIGFDNLPTQGQMPTGKHTDNGTVFQPSLPSASFVRFTLKLF